MTRAINIAQSGGNNFTMRNRIINGDMKIDQRNAGASSTPTTSGTFFGVDRWAAAMSQSSKFSMQQNAGSVTPPAGFTNYLGITSLSAYSVTGSDYFAVYQKIEANNMSDLGWGAAGAQTVSLSFWVRSSLTGTFGGSLQNDAESWMYSFTYTISQANTWTYVTVTVPGATSGTWLTGVSNGMYVWLGLGATGTRVGTAGAWGTQSGAGLQPSGTVSVVGTSGATFYVTGVQLEAGTTSTPFETRPYGMELALCQRYYYRLTGGGNTRHAIAGNGGSPNCFPVVFFKQTMRSIPTFSYSALSDFAVEGNAGGQATPTSLSWNAGTTENAAINCVTTSGITNYGGNLLGTGSGAYTAYSAEL